MILEYITVLFRYLRKQANIAVINLLSYGVGIAACLILIQYIYHETSYDKFYKDHESVYRISLDNYYSRIYQSSTAFTFLPVGPSLSEKYPEVEGFTVLQNRQEVVTVEENSFFEKRIIVADTNYFRIFHQDLLRGSLQNVRPSDVFVSEAIATKYFGERDPIGKTMKVFRDSYTVKGVFKDLPNTTHLKFDILCLVAVRESSDWNVPFMYTYIKLNADPKNFNQKLGAFSEEFSKLTNQQSEADYTFQLKLQPLTSIHLQSNLLDEVEINGKIEDVYILSAIAVMILIITCFNYINLTHAVNSLRSKETFVRKIHGASKRNSVSQHLVESVALNVVGFSISIFALIIFANWVGPYFDFPKLEIDWSASITYYVLLTIFASALLLSGIVPAVLNINTGHIKILNRPSSTHSPNLAFTRNIAFAQLVTSCILISGSLVVLKQITFMREGDLGFSDKGVMGLEINALNYHQNEDAFLRVKNDLKKIASIEDVSFSSSLPGEQLINTSIRLSSESVENTRNCDVQVITSDYFSVYGMEMAHGRLFSEADPADALTVVVNESLAKELSQGDYESLIDKEVTVDWARNAVKFRVIGIAKDFHHSSKKQKIQPMLFIQLKNTFAVFRISVKSSDIGNWKSTELLVRKVLKENLSESYSKRGIQVAFDAVEVEAAYNKQHTGDERFSKFLNALTFLAISMACIGFFSLASITTRKRTKEVVIRKVYGARIADMSTLLYSDFLKLAGVALAIALPLSYFFTQNWLEGFYSRIEMGVWFALWPIVIVLGLTLLSISYFILKLVLINPTHQLRND